MRAYIDRDINRRRIKPARNTSLIGLLYGFIAHHAADLNSNINTLVKVFMPVKITTAIIHGDMRGHRGRCTDAWFQSPRFRRCAGDYWGQRWHRYQLSPFFSCTGDVCGDVVNRTEASVPGVAICPLMFLVGVESIEKSRFITHPPTCAW